jgi:hypothetical protein
MRRHGAMAFLGMMVLIAIYVVIFASILIFFQTFKYHVWRVLVEEYTWNRVQDMPLSLLSMDVNDQPFVMQMNKIYYGKLPEVQTQQFIDGVRKKVITPQLLSGFDPNEPEKYPFWYVISIGGKTFSETIAPNCKCKLGDISYGVYWYKCSTECNNLKTGLAGSECWSGAPVFRPPDIETRCLRMAGVVDIAIYNMSYPFPLAFSGTWNLTIPFYYNIIHYIFNK